MKSTLTRRGADCLAQWLIDKNIPAQPRQHENGSWSVLCGVNMEHFWSRREAETWLKGPTLTISGAEVSK